MPSDYTDGDFTTAQQNGPETQSRPFSETGDATHRVITRPMIVNLADYSPLALDTVHPTIATAYLVKESNFQPQSCGVMTFDRIYATIPASRDDVFTGTTAYSFPGLEGSLANGTERTVTAVSTTSTATTITCTNSVSVGDVVRYNLTPTEGIRAIGYSRALTGTTSTAVKVPPFFFTAFDSGTLTELGIQPRAQKSLPTGSVTDYSYALPGVTAGVTTFDDVTETPVFAPFNAETGAAVRTLNANTIPSQNEYQSDVDAGNYLVIESNITRYMGNIIQKADVKVRAI